MSKELVNPVKLAFDPTKLGDETQAAFANSIARTLWLAIAPGHLIDVHFARECIEASRRIQDRGLLELPHVESGPTIKNILRQTFSHPLNNDVVRDEFFELLLRALYKDPELTYVVTTAA